MQQTANELSAAMFTGHGWHCLFVAQPPPWTHPLLTISSVVQLKRVRGVTSALGSDQIGCRQL